MNDLWTTSDSTKKLLELINEFSTNKFNKVTEGKINVPKSMYCFCRLIVNYQKEIKKTISCTIYDSWPQQKKKKNQPHTQKVSRDKFNQGGERPVHWNL